MKAKRSIYNLIAAFISQAITMTLGFIIPRLTLNGYGSEVNGLMTSVTQIYAYIGLLEAGLLTTSIQALYAPVAKGNRDEISGVVNAAKKYYRKIAVLYTIAVLLLSFVLPMILNSSLQWWEITGYFGLFGISNIINFWFLAGYKPLLLAEGKGYITSVITTIFHIVSQFTKIFLLQIGANIVILQAVYAVINILQLIIYYLYFNKKYKWLDKTVAPSTEKLKQRNAFFVQQLSNLIFSSTDVALISFFCGLKEASVYAVYMLIFNALSTMMSLFVSSTQFVLGQSYGEDKIRYIKIHRTYESILLTLAFILFSAAYILTLPFIRIYTAGITDVNYLDKWLPLLFCLNGLLSTCKTVPLALINCSYHAQKVIPQTLIEVAINLVSSIILVQFLGIKGVLIGTTIALVFRVVDLIYYTNKKILQTSTFQTIKLYAVNFILFFGLIVVNSFIPITLGSYLDFILKGVIIVIILAVIYIVVNILINFKYYMELFYIIKSKFLRRRKK